MLPARRALVSVFDKTGLEEMARGLYRLGIEIVSTGGTLKFLQEKGIPVVAVSDVTGFPEMLEGRVKTLHPKVHGGILAKRSDSEHLDALAEHGIERIDLVVVNLYPFRETVARGASFAETVEMIDVGGPTMVRAAAKNFDGVAVVVDPADYSRVLAALEQGRGVVPEPLRRELALKAFRQTASYDAAISEWLGGQGTAQPAGKTDDWTRSRRQGSRAAPGDGAPLWREPSSGRGGLRGRRAARGVRRLPGAPGEGALLEQPPGRRRGAQDGRPVRHLGSGGHHRQAQQSVRHRPRRRTSPRRTGGLSRPIRSRPSAR